MQRHLRKMSIFLKSGNMKGCQHFYNVQLEKNNKIGGF